jgi:hypothetical protein
MDERRQLVAKVIESWIQALHIFEPELPDLEARRLVRVAIDALLEAWRISEKVPVEKGA